MIPFSIFHKKSTTLTLSKHPPDYKVKDPLNQEVAVIKKTNTTYRITMSYAWADKNGFTISSKGATYYGSEIGGEYSTPEDAVKDLQKMVDSFLLSSTKK